MTEDKRYCDFCECPRDPADFDRGRAIRLLRKFFRGKCIADVVENSKTKRRVIPEAQTENQSGVEFGLTMFGLAKRTRELPKGE